MGDTSAAGRPRARSLADPTAYSPFGSFSCALGAPTAYEQEVDELVEELYYHDSWRGRVRVIEAEDSGALMGLCAFMRSPIVTEPPSDDYDRAIYIAILALAGAQRNRAPARDGTTLGGFLLRDALHQIKRVWGEPTMPPVWGLVHPENVRCLRLLRRYGFGEVPSTGEHLALLRDEGVEPPPAATPPG